MSMELRDYQASAVKEALASLARGGSVLLIAPTGSGKTVMFAAVVARYVARRRRVLVVAHRRELLTQAHDKLAAAGVASHVHRARKAPIPRGARVVVASVQTLGGALPPGFAPALVVVDEAHHLPADSFRAVVDAAAGAHVLGATATPWWQSEKPLDEHFGAVVRAPAIRDLTAAGHLARVRMFTHPHTLRDLDLRGVRTEAGDYAVGAVSERVDRPALLGDMVEHWKTHARGARTLAFAASVEHSRHIVARFLAAGVAADHLDGKTPDDERRAILARLESGATRVVSNYNVLSEGFDAPAVGCVILARPTRRVGVYLQCVGRGMRPGGEFPDVVVLDHAGLCLAFGLPDEERDIVEPQRRGNGKPPVRRCPSCGLWVPVAAMECSECSERMRSSAPTEEPQGALVEVMCGLPQEMRMFRGELRTAGEVSSATGVPCGVVRGWFDKRLDIDAMAERYRPKIALRLAFRGEMRTSREVATITGLPYPTVEKWFHSARDIDEAVARHRPVTRGDRMPFDGEMRSIRSVATMTGVPQKVVAGWFKARVDINAAVASFQRKGPKRLMFDGAMRTAAEVVTLTGCGVRAVSVWFTKSRDIDAMVAKYAARPPEEVTREFRGAPHTIQQIHDATGVPVAVVRSWFGRRNDIDTMVAKYRPRKKSDPR